MTIGTTWFRPRLAGPPAGRLNGAVVAIAALCLSTTARADPPLLQQLSDETQHLYGRARLGMVRVRLPTPQWLAQENRLRQFMAKWGNQLDPAVRERLIAEQERAAVAAHAGASTQPIGRPATVPAWPTTAPATALTVADSPAAADRVLVATGVLVDSAGHVVFPLYIDRSDLGTPPTLAALTGDGRPAVATFVGSDRNTNLTVLKLDDPGPSPAPLLVTADASRPADGSVALVVTPEGSAHLTVWTSTSADIGLVIRPDGTFAGFGFPDDFVSAATARPIVAQLVATGTVRRPVLGVVGVAVRRSYLFDPAVVAADDAADAAGGGPAAVYVRAVEPNSAADRAGVRPADVILAVAGQPVGPRTFAAVIAARRGKTVLRVRRASQALDVTVDLQVE